MRVVWKTSAETWAAFGRLPLISWYCWTVAATAAAVESAPATTVAAKNKKNTTASPASTPIVLPTVDLRRATPGSKCGGSDFRRPPGDLRPRSTLVRVTVRWLPFVPGLYRYAMDWLSHLIAAEQEEKSRVRSHR